MNKVTNEQLDSLIKSAVNSSGPLPHDEKFSQIISALRELRTHRNLINERGNFSKSTNNHPAHGPVSLERLHQISEILSKAAAQSDGGNLGYAMADAVKVIDGAIAAFGAEPVAWLHSDNGIGIPAITRSRNVADSWFSKGWNIKPLYTTPPATVVDADDNFYSWFGREWEKYYQPNNYSLSAKKHLGAIAESAWFACRSVMLQRKAESTETDQMQEK